MVGTQTLLRRRPDNNMKFLTKRFSELHKSSLNLAFFPLLHKNIISEACSLKTLVILRNHITSLIYQIALIVDLSMKQRRHECCGFATQNLQPYIACALPLPMSKHKLQRKDCSEKLIPLMLKRLSKPLFPLKLFTLSFLSEDTEEILYCNF